MFRTTMVRSLVLCSSLAAGVSALAQPFAFSTGSPDGRLAAASRPDTGGVLEIEAADDFVLGHGTALTSATFTGLLPQGVNVSSIRNVTIEIYRVFPFDSDTTRTITVPTRTNSPSDIAFQSRTSSDNSLSYTTQVVSSNFTAANSVVNGIHASPNQRTGGEGPVSGTEVEFSVALLDPFFLPDGHYFFIPQVEMADGIFLWLSAPKPIVSPGTPFTPDLQAWIRNGDLDPDWLRIGTDIVGAGAFNMAYTLTGTTLCVADVDDGTGSGTPDYGVTIDDLLYYLVIFADGSARADIDDGSGTGVRDGGVTIDDLLFFLQHFADGC